MKIQPIKKIHGNLRLPGDKSISHRAAMISALAQGRSRISNFSTSEDCTSTLQCLQELGVSFEYDTTMATVHVEGAGIDGLRAPRRPLDCGNSGSTMRMLAGVLAGQDFTATLTGDDSLRSRPMRRIIEPLELMGAQIESEQGRAPLRITGRYPLQAINYEMPTPSAQVKSAVLLAGLRAEGHTAVIDTTGSTRDHTERMLRWFGVEVETRSEARSTKAAEVKVAAVTGPANLSARDYVVPGDISSAAFFLVAAGVLPGSNLRIENVGLNPTRAELLNTLQGLGVDVRVVEEREQCNEEVGDVMVSGRGSLAPIEADANILRGARVAGLIDEIPVLAVLGTQVEGGLEVRDAKELRVKESDRIRATVDNLRRMGVDVEEYEDGLRVNKCSRLRGASVDAYGDHRIAMALTVAALIADGETEINGADCVRISFPNFFTLLESVVER